MFSFIFVFIIISFAIPYWLGLFCIFSIENNWKAYCHVHVNFYLWTIDTRMEIGFEKFVFSRDEHFRYSFVPRKRKKIWAIYFVRGIREHVSYWLYFFPAKIDKVGYERNSISLSADSLKVLLLGPEEPLNFSLKTRFLCFARLFKFSFFSPFTDIF